MLLKVFGLADILSVLALSIAPVLPPSLVLIMALYLMLKGLIFSLMGDMISLIDILIGFYILLVSAGLSQWIITLIASVYILQKAIAPVFS